MGFPTLKKVYNRFKGNESVVFAAIQTVFEGHSVNTKDKLADTQEKYDLPIPMGHDGLFVSTSMPIPKTMADYRSGGTPWVVIIDKKGMVAFNDFHIQFNDAQKLIMDLITRE